LGCGVVWARRNPDTADNLHLKDVTKPNCNHFWLSMGYNFGCVIASGTIFDSIEWFFGFTLSDEDIADFEVLGDVTMADNFRTQIAVSGFVRTIATGLLIREGFSGRRTKCRYCRYAATKEHCGDNYFFGVVCMGCTLVTPGEYD